MTQLSRSFVGKGGLIGQSSEAPTVASGLVGVPSHHPFGRRPLRSGSGGASPFGGTRNRSVIWASNARAIRSRTATVGFSKPRSSRLTYVRSIEASTANASCETPCVTRSRRRFRATSAFAFMREGQRLRPTLPAHIAGRTVLLHSLRRICPAAATQAGWRMVHRCRAGGLLRWLRPRRYAAQARGLSRACSGDGRTFVLPRVWSNARR
jgi:hypothetical protein